MHPIFFYPSYLSWMKNWIRFTSQLWIFLFLCCFLKVAEGQFQTEQMSTSHFSNSRDSDYLLVRTHRDWGKAKTLWSRMEERVSAWESGHAVCQEVHTDSICRSRSACPSHKLLQPPRYCRLSNRSVFGRTINEESIMSRSGLKQLPGVCCYTENVVETETVMEENDTTSVSGNGADANLPKNESLFTTGSQLVTPSPSTVTEEELTDTSNTLSTATEERAGKPSSSSEADKSASGASFDIMPYRDYSTLMAQSAHLTNMLLGAAQINYAGQTKHKNFTEFNLADLGLDCGKRNLTYKMMRLGRIVGGETAGFSDWPWVAMVLNYGRPRCGGTLLSSEAVLTAAHCVSGNMLLYNLTVRIGMFNTNERENLPFPPLLLRVKRIIRHPLFDLTTLLNDVAILQLSQPVTFAPNIMPACIASQEYPPNTPTTILGWGKEEENNTVYELPDSLQAVTVPIINRADCAKYFSGQGLIDLIGPQHICAGSDQGGKDACQGDSGGPMLLENPDGRYELLGIISWGFGCGEPHVPGVYTNIHHYRQWIVDTIRNL